MRKSDFIEINLLNHSVVFCYEGGIYKPKSRYYKRITPSSYCRLMTALGERYQRKLFLSAVTPGLLKVKIDRNS